MRFNADSNFRWRVMMEVQWIGILATSPTQETGGTRYAVMGGGKLTHQDPSKCYSICLAVDTAGNDCRFWRFIKCKFFSIHRIVTQSKRDIFWHAYTPGNVSNLIEICDNRIHRRFGRFWW